MCIKISLEGRGDAHRPFAQSILGVFDSLNVLGVVTHPGWDLDMGGRICTKRQLVKDPTPAPPFEGRGYAHRPFAQSILAVFDSLNVLGVVTYPDGVWIWADGYARKDKLSKTPPQPLPLRREHRQDYNAL